MPYGVLSKNWTIETQTVREIWCVDNALFPSYIQSSVADEELYRDFLFDQDFYRVNYVFPRWAQYIAAFLAVGIITVGVLQLFL